MLIAEAEPNPDRNNLQNIGVRRRTVNKRTIYSEFIPGRQGATTVLSTATEFADVYLSHSHPSADIARRCSPHAIC
ncbi:jg138 [Pararge aegeria aegeria]|uniref:Jg138 protein n=1 Tax=Pararge aegeria aegeria TaxID=348720 RepID=A0A8S4QI22_9NEOP|nr:jg138 [Pararge aegeria aegeria]